MLIANGSLYQYALIDISAVVDSAILATIISHIRHSAVHINKIQLFASIQEPPTEACVCCLCVCTEVGHIHGLVWFLWVIRCQK